MSELISGKDVLIALANGKNVDACVTFRKNRDEWHWFDAKNLTVNEIEAMETEGDPDGENIKAIAFRLKPRTITINGIEVSAPFEPQHNEEYFYLNLQRECLYAAKIFNGNHSDNSAVELGAWRTEEEIKQVVSALRSVFNGGVR